eukprot:39530_1
MSENSMPVESVYNYNMSLIFVIDPAQCKSIITNWTRNCGIIFHDVLHDIIHAGVSGFIITTNPDPDTEGFPFFAYVINGMRTLKVGMNNKIRCKLFMGWNQINLGFFIPKMESLLHVSQRIYHWSPTIQVIVSINDVSQQFTMNHYRAQTVATVIRDDLCSTNCVLRCPHDGVLIKNNIYNFNIKILCITYQRHKRDIKRMNYYDIKPIVPLSQEISFIEEKKLKKKKINKRKKKISKTKKHTNYYCYLQRTKKVSKNNNRKITSTTQKRYHL